MTDIVFVCEVTPAAPTQFSIHIPTAEGAVRLAEVEMSLPVITTPDAAAPPVT